MSSRQNQSVSLPVPAPPPVLCAAFAALTPIQQVSAEATFHGLYGHLRRSPTPEGRIEWINAIYANGWAEAIYVDADPVRPPPTRQAQQ
ncbi:hypothetical protein NHQ30_005891 [Ciborinia camelliae]|nr:hypothetical protein NHQ30_005891 [Ciborinia camelliae]